MPRAESTSDIDNAWASLDEELNAWTSIGRVAEFWWRDDDAVADGPKLEQLLELSSRCGLLLAVIPKKLEASLVGALNSAPHTYVAQHGYAHINHAPRGRGLGAWELGLHRGLDVVMAELATGRDLLTSNFASQFLPVIVPPWNRIAPELLQPITEFGFHGVSAFGSRQNETHEQGLTIINSHCDPIRWKTGPHFRGTVKTISQFIEHLQAKRAGTVDTDEPTGYLTHHIDLDDAGWAFSLQLARMISEHTAANWCSPKTLFGMPND